MCRLVSPPVERVRGGAGVAHPGCASRQTNLPSKPERKRRRVSLKGQLDLELHGGRSPSGVAVRVAQRILALTAAIWHNRATGRPTTRSLIAYDH